jgi:ribonuclease P protein component
MSATGTGRFGRDRRLVKATDFRPVFARPDCKSTDASFTVLARHNRIGRARLGLAIAKKHIRLAVTRNRVKRLVRESFRGHQRALFGLDVVVLARPSTASQSNPQLRMSLVEHWNRITRRSS